MATDYNHGPSIYPAGALAHRVSGRRMEIEQPAMTHIHSFLGKYIKTQMWLPRGGNWALLCCLTLCGQHGIPLCVPHAIGWKPLCLSHKTNYTCSMGLRVLRSVGEEVGSPSMTSGLKLHLLLFHRVLLRRSWGK